MPVNYSEAAEMLADHCSSVEVLVIEDRYRSPLPTEINEACQLLFSSATQAYREVLLGCTLARIQDQSLDIRLPYINLGETAFNGRTLDERVVNPLLHSRRIPCSKGPYLSVFRRSVKLDESTRAGVRDKTGYDGLLRCLQYLEQTTERSHHVEFLDHLLSQFLVLRESSNVALNRLQRFSLEQYSALIPLLLATPSGGRFPMFLVVSAFQAIKFHFELEWEIEWQGINVSDRAAGAGGDITISDGGEVRLSAEVTERVVNRARVVSTFNTKIGPAGIEDYLFFVIPEPGPAARQQAHQYFAQGHEISFVQIQSWIIMTLATIGVRGRAEFNRGLLRLLSDTNVPKALKVAWNHCTSQILSPRQ